MLQQIPLRASLSFFLLCLNGCLVAYASGSQSCPKYSLGRTFLTFLTNMSVHLSIEALAFLGAEVATRSKNLKKKNSTLAIVI